MWGDLWNYMREVIFTIGGERALVYPLFLMCYIAAECYVDFSICLETGGSMGEFMGFLIDV